MQKYALSYNLIHLCPAFIQIENQTHESLYGFLNQGDKVALFFPVFNPKLIRKKFGTLYFCNCLRYLYFQTLRFRRSRCLRDPFWQRNLCQHKYTTALLSVILIKSGIFLLGQHFFCLQGKRAVAVSYRTIQVRSKHRMFIFVRKDETVKAYLCCVQLLTSFCNYAQLSQP